ncbi:hypothetical protein EG329_007901 [Mollisiaceae sp. DMI_Dod_QoI]|nr:hypothetical protein EG329_007901 [Helotiales sp. DMI_Dod_QoI]
MGPSYHVGLVDSFTPNRLVKKSVDGENPIYYFDNSVRGYSRLATDCEDSRNAPVELLRERYMDWIKADTSRHIHDGIRLDMRPECSVLPSPFNLGEQWYELAMEIIKADLHLAENWYERKYFWSSFYITKRRSGEFATTVAERIWNVGLEALKLLEYDESKARVGDGDA